MKDTDNFHAYFPGGFKRPEAYDVEMGEKVPERLARLVSDLDRIIEQYKFDVEAFQREKQLWFSGRGEESRVHCQNIQDMIYPLYLEMLNLGYSKSELHA